FYCRCLPAYRAAEVFHEISKAMLGVLWGVMIMIEILSANRAWKKLLLAASASALLLWALAGCEGRDPPEPVVRSVEWYEAHDAERAEKLAECKTRPEAFDGQPDCVNASRAENSTKAATKWHEEADADEVRTKPLLSR